jgi:hypothetical protein
MAMDTPRELPAVLYKYMPAERNTIFDNWLIRFTQPRALNDPFEMRPHIAGYRAWFRKARFWVPLFRAVPPDKVGERYQ